MSAEPVPGADPGGDDRAVQFDRGVVGVHAERAATGTATDGRSCAAGTTRAKELGLAAILRVFLLDSIALESLDKIPANLPDCLDLLPGAMPKILRRVCAKAKVPVLTGGLIVDKEDVMAALEAGATAMSTTNQAVWDR